jgi:myo-inositol-1(or 4)-monophosphatase
LYPDDLFVGEEDAGQGDGSQAAEPWANARDRIVWIVDPLDGTTNYAHGVPHYAVSVAATRGGEVLAGAVYNPAADECFTAACTGTAQLNGQPIRVSGVERLSDALVAGSISAGVRRDSAEASNLLNVIEQAQSFRRSGSAALNMCYVAAGRYDAYWATETRAWDIAAGWLIVERAGGVVRGLNGGRFHLEVPQPLAAATQSLSDQLMALIQR